MSRPSNPYRAAGTFSGETYVERQADRDLLRAIRQNQRYPYVLAPRQSGKSSLILHVSSLLGAPEFRTAFVDFSTFDPQETANFDAFRVRFFEECRRSLDLTEALPTCERFLDGMEQLLARCPDERLVLFLDEVDALMQSAFRDTFFSILRNLFNERAGRPELKRFQFVLAGAARPEELISDHLRSPFNVGESIQLCDLSREETAQVCGPLVRQVPASAEVLADAVYVQTNGTVYLTQVVLEKLWNSVVVEAAEAPSDEEWGGLVERVAKDVVAGAARDLHFESIQSSLRWNSDALRVFHTLLAGGRVSVTERELLWFIGLAPREGPAIYRNRIYERVFRAGGPLDQVTSWRREHARSQRFPAWIFGSLAFGTLLYIAVLGPAQYSLYQHQILGILCATLVALFSYFFSGSSHFVATGQLAKMGRAGVAIVAFVLAQWWWNAETKPLKRTSDSTAQMVALVLQKLNEVEQTGNTLDFRSAFRGAAHQSHVSPEEVERVVREWVAENQNDPDLSERAKAEFLSQNFTKAAELSERAAAERLGQSTRFREERARLVASAVKDLQEAGRALYSNRQLSEALASFERALGYVSREESGTNWGALQRWIGRCHDGLSTQITDSSVGFHFSRATNAFREAMKAYPRERFPQDWALTQNDLGVALRHQGDRSERPEAARYLAEAVVAFRGALQMQTREESPQGWAQTQNNLGNALRDQAGRSEGPEAKLLLAEAIAAFREALQTQTREESPQGWAQTQNNLGNALRDQAGRSEGPEAKLLLAEAIAAFREALQTQTREESPQGWAQTQNNLGNVFRDLAARSEGPEAKLLLAEAVVAFRAALEVRTREKSSQEWAATLNNLGNTLSDQASRSEGPEAAQLLGEATIAFRAVLKVRTREEFPQDWATAQNNLGAALCAQAGWSKGAEAARQLDEAVNAFRAALQIWSAEESPGYHTLALGNLAKAEENLRKLRP